MEYQQNNNSKQIQIENIRDEIRSINENYVLLEKRLREIETRGCTFGHILQRSTEKMKQENDKKLEKIEGQQDQLKNIINRWGGAIAVFGIFPSLLSILYIAFQLHRLISG